jgi:hypothetical protein
MTQAASVAAGAGIVIGWGEWLGLPDRVLFRCEFARQGPAAHSQC